jgi:uncharacterized protein (TIGR03435 family)
MGSASPAQNLADWGMTMGFARSCELAGFGLAFAFSVAAAQAPATGQAAPEGKAPVYEVASVRQNTNPNPRWNMSFTPDGLHAVDITLLWAMGEAYGMPDLSLITGGPAWVDQKRFDIEAKFDVSEYPNPTPERRLEMLQQLLADRFKLAVHREAKESPLYALVVTRGGAKVEETRPEEIQRSRLTGLPVCHVTASRRGSVGLKGCTSADLANLLYGVAKSDLGRRVVDQTGLKGRYTVELHWAPVNTANPTDAASGASDASGPSIFTAVKEQLGLELKPTKGPVDTLVIDHAELPTEN